MHRQSAAGPRLEALLVERDYLRIKLLLAEQKPGVEPGELTATRAELVLLEREITKNWKNPNA